jgi:hypothetical protein
MDFKYHLETAWKLMLDHIAALIILTLATAAASVLSLGILAPVAFAGYVHAIVRLLKDGREPEAGDVFSQMRLFLPLFFFGVAVFVGAMIGFTLFFIPGVLFLVLVSFCCLYMIPLMVERDLGLVDAVMESYEMVTKDGVRDHVVALVIFAGISAVGSSVLLGVLFTQPLATIFLVSIYLSLAGAEAPAPGESAAEATEAEES